MMMILSHVKSTGFTAFFAFNTSFISLRAFVLFLEIILTCHSRKSTQLSVMKLMMAEFYIAA